MVEMTNNCGSRWLHQKIIVEDSVLWPDAYANYYRTNPATVASPLILYFGGAISTSVYDSRRQTEPVAIKAEFESAVAHMGYPAADLLVIPNPPVGRASPDYRRRMFTFVLQEMLPLVRDGKARYQATLGYSYGAYLAAMLTFELRQVRALATLGGVGMPEAAEESEHRLFADKRYLCFKNESDITGSYSQAFSLSMAIHRIKVDVIERPGTHGFDDYAKNCSVRHAFAFLLNSALGRHS